MRRPRLYFSLRSPYSWLTVRRLRASVPQLSSAFECFPYWDPDPHTAAALTGRGGEFLYVQMSRAKHLYLLADTRRLAERDGLAMHWPVDLEPWWELPNLAWLQARHQGREWPFYDALVQARWERGENICEPDVLRRAAERAGLDPEQAVLAPADPQLRAEAVDCLYQAYLDDVFGIPYLRWGRHRFWGYDRLAAFLELWREPAGSPAVPADLAADSLADPADSLTEQVSGDRDCAGGCG
ncbi:MAG: 2-hydroxychromene-2-carboxylate isomerase [Jatrophihabitans sp.]